jgi:serine/threonine protein kinase
VSVYEAGEVGPICFIVSAYCPGQTLAAWLKEQTTPIPFAVASALVATLADAVQHAHEHGIVHRDLKPANILLQKVASSQCPVVSSKDDSVVGPSTGHWLLTTDYSPKITDFGLAKLLLEGQSTAQTQSGAVLGTPAYMAPEQAVGGSKGVGPAVDIYALGAILYELLTSRPPFQSETVLDTLRQVETEEPLSPSRLRSGCRATCRRFV